MAQDLDLHQLFKRSPKDWLRRYFQEQGTPLDIDWKAVGDRNVDELMRAILQLDEDLRGRMVEDFVHIKLLATPAGKVQIIDEAGFYGVQDEGARKLAELDDISMRAHSTRGL